MSIPGGDAVHKISIIPRGIAALGYTMQLPTEDRFLMTESELKTALPSSLGGRRRRSHLWRSSTGAQDDLRKATDIAKSMIKSRDEREAGPGQPGAGPAIQSFCKPVHPKRRATIASRPPGKSIARFAGLIDEQYERARDLIRPRRPHCGTPLKSAGKERSPARELQSPQPRSKGSFKRPSTLRLVFGGHGSNPRPLADLTTACPHQPLMRH